MPSDSTLFFRIAPASASSWAFISQGIAWTSSTCSPWPCSARAASSPSSPPPMTTARRQLLVASSIARVSSMVRKPYTPGSSPPSAVRTPAIGGTNE